MKMDFCWDSSIYATRYITTDDLIKYLWQSCQADSIGLHIYVYNQKGWRPSTTVKYVLKCLESADIDIKNPHGNFLIFHKPIQASSRQNASSLHQIFFSERLT